MKKNDLSKKLKQIDGKGYKAYKDITGDYIFTDFRLIIDHAQGDPFAQPSRIRIRIDREKSGFKYDTTKNRSRRIALCDYLTRTFHKNCKKYSKGIRGSGKSGLITIDQPAQEILERSSMIINENYLEARFFMGLPAFGRKIDGKTAENMFIDELPVIVKNSLFMKHLDEKKVYHHIKTSEDADFLRNTLEEKRIICFIADGTLLPRRSGIDPRPMKEKNAVLFKSPPEYRVNIDLPNRGPVSGMGIPEGVTLIVGGGYHGKSTLLNAIELGIYNHIPDDGRELAVSNKNTLKIRASDGRNITHTDISPFINNLPFQKNTESFSTGNASGSTSQAASITEGIEAGANVLLLDEDTSATNFMIRDHRMQQLVAKKDEPITPFIDKVKQLYNELGISTILVIGGSGDYFSVSDHVIQMTEYLPTDVTGPAHEIAKKMVSGRIDEGTANFGEIGRRIPHKKGFNPFRENNRLKIEPDGVRGILFGRVTVDLGDIEQLVETSQTRAIGYAIYYATKYMDGEKTLFEIVDQTLKDIDLKGLDILPPYLTGDLSCFRRIELAAAINRMRTLQVTQKN